MNKHQKKIAADLLRLAYEVKPETELPASIMAAQAIHETGWLEKIPIDNTEDNMGKLSYNILGIKAVPEKGWVGSNGFVVCGTHEQEGDKYVFHPRGIFRAYNNYEECFRDYGVVIWNSMVNVKVFGVKTPLKKRRYELALRYRTDPSMYLFYLWKAGYASDENYVKKVWQLAVQCKYLRSKEYKDLIKEEK